MCIECGTSPKPRSQQVLVRVSFKLPDPLPAFGMLVRRWRILGRSLEMDVGRRSLTVIPAPNCGGVDFLQFSIECRGRRVSATT